MASKGQPDFCQVCRTSPCDCQTDRAVGADQLPAGGGNVQQARHDIPAAMQAALAVWLVFLVVTVARAIFLIMERYM